METAAHSKGLAVLLNLFARSELSSKAFIMSDHLSWTSRMALVTCAGRQSSECLSVSASLTKRGTDCLCSGLSFHGCVESKQPGQMETVTSLEQRAGSLLFLKGLGFLAPGSSPVTHHRGAACPRAPAEGNQEGK